MSHVERAHGAAQRRRGRLVRSWWRHEQRSIAATVATMLHHSAGRKPLLVDAATQVGSLLAPVTEYVAPAPAVVCDVPATVIEYTSSAPVIECVAPAPAVTYVVPSQQFTPVFSTTTVTTDLVYPQFSSTAVVPSSPCVVGSLPPVEEFTKPVYDQVLQEHIAASEFTEKSAEFPVVIVQDIPGVNAPLPPVQEFTGPVHDQVHQELVASSEMTENFTEIHVVPLPPAQEFSASVYGSVHQVFVGMRPERLVDARRPQRCGRTVPVVGVPVLAVQSLRGFEGVDNTATKFLLQQALKKKKEEEEKEEKPKEAQQVKQEQILARQRAATRELDTQEKGPVRAPLGPGERQG